MPNPWPHPATVPAWPASCHELRHTCLTRLREAGMALEAVQAQAGHASIETTRIYLHLADDWLAGEYRRASEAIDAQALAAGSGSCRRSRTPAGQPAGRDDRGLPGPDLLVVAGVQRLARPGRAASLRRLHGRAPPRGNEDGDTRFPRWCACDSSSAMHGPTQGSHGVHVIPPQWLDLHDGPRSGSGDDRTAADMHGGRRYRKNTRSSGCRSAMVMCGRSAAVDTHLPPGANGHPRAVETFGARRRPHVASPPRPSGRACP